MQTFLPPSYSFSPDKLINQKSDEFIIENTHLSQSGGIIYFVIVVLTIIIIAYIFTLKKTNSETKQDDDMPNAIVQIVMLCAAGAFLMSLCALNGHMNSTTTKTYTANASFKLPIKSNLYVHMLDKQHKPKSIKDHKQYPYKIYLDNSKKHSYHLQADRPFVTGRYSNYY